MIFGVGRWRIADKNGNNERARNEKNSDEGSGSLICGVSLLVLLDGMSGRV